MKKSSLILLLFVLFVLSAISASAQENIAFKVELPEATITAQNIPHIAYNNKVVSIKDFEINEKGIYLIAQRRRNNAILHLNFACDTLKELKISPAYYNIFKLMTRFFLTTITFISSLLMKIKHSFTIMYVNLSVNIRSLFINTAIGAAKCKSSRNGEKR